jgi:hypothetical protein
MIARLQSFALRHVLTQHMERMQRRVLVMIAGDLEQTSLVSVCKQ